MAIRSLMLHTTFLSKLVPKSLSLQKNLCVHNEILQGRILVSWSCCTVQRRPFQTVNTPCMKPMCTSTVEKCYVTSNGYFTSASSFERSKHLSFVHVYPIDALCFGEKQSKVLANDFSSDSSKSSTTSESEKIRKEEISTDAKLSSGEQEYKKLSLVQRYKKMLKEYWYVLIPVHIATSIVWFGSFYYAAKSGIDIVPYLEVMGVSEVILRPLRDSGLGYLAVASAMYKIATPVRYMVTLGGTTFAIRYLSRRGIIKPMPSKDQLKSMINKKLTKDRTNSGEKE